MKVGVRKPGLEKGKGGEVSFINRVVSI